MSDGLIYVLIHISVGKNVLSFSQYDKIKLPSDTSSNPLLKLFIPCYLSAQIFVILSVNVSTAGPSGRAV